MVWIFSYIHAGNAQVHILHGTDLKIPEQLYGCILTYLSTKSVYIATQINNNF